MMGDESDLPFDRPDARRKFAKHEFQPNTNMFNANQHQLQQQQHHHQQQHQQHQQQHHQQLYMNHPNVPINMKADISYSGLVPNYDSDDSDADEEDLVHMYPPAPPHAVAAHPNSLQHQHQHQHQQQINHQIMASQMNMNSVGVVYNNVPVSSQIALKRKKSSSNGFDIIYRCLLVYKEINGHLMVPKRFVIPESMEYPQESWGMKIGHSVCNIRNIGSYSEHRDKLEAIGFTFKSSLGRVNPQAPQQQLHHQAVVDYSM